MRWRRACCVSLTAMKIFLLACCLAACTSHHTAGGDDDVSVDAPPPNSDPLRTIFDRVDRAHIGSVLGELTGVRPIPVNGAQVRLTDRWSPAMKARFRAYYTAFFTQLGAQVNEQTFPIPNLVGETTGHNVEAVLPGQ